MEANHPADDSPDALRAAIAHAAHLLPAQGPITVFIHHNTLHAFEQLPFDDAVRRGGEVFGCEPYLTEERYRAELRKGRIRVSDLEAVLHKEVAIAGDPLIGTSTPLDIRQAMLERPIWSATTAELAYYLDETGALRAFREDVPSNTRLRMVAETRRWVMRDLRGRAVGPDWVGDLFRRYEARTIETWTDATWEAVTVESLWRVCLDGVRHAAAPSRPPARYRRPRDLLLCATGTDTDLWVNDLLLRYTAAFLDQGLSGWPLPDRGDGLFGGFLRTYARPGGPPDAWLRPLRAECERLLTAGTDALASARESLDRLGVPPAEWDDFLSATLMPLRGWGGMVREVEARGDRVAQPIPPGSLEGFVAVRLLLDRLAAEHLARTELGYRGPLAELKHHLPTNGNGKGNGEWQPPAANQRAFPVFQLAQLLGWSPEELSALSAEEWANLFREVEAFDPLERRRVFHHAYERRFRIQTLDAIGLHAPHRFPDGLRPRFQVVTCLDEREESFRRHIEEVAPDAETYGVAGFFNVVMYYRGAADAHYIPLCPIVVTPTRWVAEEVDEQHLSDHERRKRARRAIGGAAHRLTWWSRSFAFGAILSACVGALATIPLVARILFPRLTGRLRQRLGRIVRTPPATRLKLVRSAAEPGRTGEAVGFSLGEMADAAERFLRDIGLTGGFARLVFLIGHGSDSVNNPHKSAYDCGACGGSPGGPNGRAIAEMLNHPDIRRTVAERGIAIPDDTRFVGGYHNTCDDSVTLLDTDRVPDTHRAEFERVAGELAAACDRNAHERTRRFMSAPLDQSAPEAHWHVENRSEDLAQVRPELGHATNAICVVGRRSRTRGLYLDRRAFLASYDPTQDDADGFTLGRLLGAAVPVCGGINLEYYFSHVDSQGYGCGTKLPHNVSALLGVMDGAASDLRTGLPWQMVEIHEPVRLLFVVETWPEVLVRVMDRIRVVGDLIRNGWVQLAVLDPNSGDLRVYRAGEFVLTPPTATALPTAPSSADWYRGWREHLDFAEIGPSPRFGDRVAGM